MTSTKTAAQEQAKPAPKDAIALLKADHEAVSQLFAEYEKTRSVPNKKGTGRRDLHGTQRACADLISDDVQQAHAVSH